MKASPRTHAAVQATLQQWKDAYSQQDLDGALAVIAPDDDVVGIGTGPDEWRVGPEEFRAQLERDFAQSEALSIDYEPAGNDGAHRAPRMERQGQLPSPLP